MKNPTDAYEPPSFHLAQQKITPAKTLESALAALAKWREDLVQERDKYARLAEETSSPTMRRRHLRNVARIDHALAQAPSSNVVLPDEEEEK